MPRRLCQICFGLLFTGDLCLLFLGNARALVAQAQLDVVLSPDALKDPEKRDETMRILKVAYRSDASVLEALGLMAAILSGVGLGASLWPIRRKNDAALPKDW